jgi:VanZ family protein
VISPRPASKHTAALGLATLAYAFFVVYGSLVPLNYHYRPLLTAWDAFLRTPYLNLDLGSRADWVANILLYIPLAFLATGWLASLTRSRGIVAGIVVFALCAALAVAVEFTQLYFPPRTVSLNDIIAEIIGSGFGLVLWVSAGERIMALWSEVLQGSAASGRALIILYTAAYLAFALFPFDFVVSAPELAEKLADRARFSLLVTQSCGGPLRCSAKLVSEILTVAPLGIFLGMIATPARQGALGRAFGWGLFLGALIEGLQTLLASGISQGASIITRGVGMMLGLAAYHSFHREWLARYRPQAKFVVLLALPFYVLFLTGVAGFLGSALESRWVAMAKLQQVRFLPFYYHYFTSETQAMYSLLLHVGAYAPIGLAVWIVGDRLSRTASVCISALAATLLASAMETLKLFLNGRHPDPTDVLIAIAAAIGAYLVATRLAQAPTGSGSTADIAPSAPQPGAAPAMYSRSRRAIFGAAALVGLAAAIGGVVAVQPREHYVDESKLPQLPAPNDLPPVDLPAFRHVHPRLPNPSGAELMTIANQNPAWLERVRSRAAGGNGEIEDVALQALIKPGSVDLALLHRRLMSLTPSGRGHEQVKPLAVAYDWLYTDWSEAQRAALKTKLADGCDYVIAYIRKDRLSPYNVILYNAPLQALMACSLALYGDDSRGEPIMRFAFDLWKNRVLPVWRQVMGRNGGWHEGGEYVGAGIGQAIYELPAMWRSATGENLFASEPEIRGFLDFLVYRRRPDGTDFRWGDGSGFDHRVPDVTALAIEFRHAAAYTLWPPREVAPSAWPWGPLADSSLIDPTAVEHLPLVHVFDGIGMMIARSDWSPDATYVTFKAGDNYWSHSHLDQGAFTIYKGGALAIDSGLYGPAYGSDHHMNYAYQTIAHNVVTVTDSADTVPAPGKDKPRPIANDGGQRRIGSGWGVEAAPIDRVEWEAKRDIYHTAEMGPLFDQGGFAVVAADITPAYTNSRSGDGTFSARTRRVDRFWRIFGYDRVDDVVVIFDQVAATSAALRKRWLLHTMNRPNVFPDGFTVDVPGQNRTGRGGGRLEARVLLPRYAVINPVGGPGLEFFVDDKNYDENGTLGESIRKLAPDGPEPGAWRVEVSPPRDQKEDMFLVVLVPSKVSAPPVHRVTLLEFGNRVGCEIVGPNRTTRWWFEPGRNAAAIDIAAGADAHHYVVTGPEAALPTTSWLDRIRSLFRSRGSRS